MLIGDEGERAPRQLDAEWAAEPVRVVHDDLAEGGLDLVGVTVRVRVRVRIRARRQGYG